MGFVWVHAYSFHRCVASPFHSFVTTTGQALPRTTIQRMCQHACVDCMCDNLVLHGESKRGQAPRIEGSDGGDHLVPQCVTWRMQEQQIAQQQRPGIAKNDQNNDTKNTNKWLANYLHLRLQQINHAA